MRIVQINLSPAENIIWEEFQRQKDAFRILAQSGVFSTKNGRAVIDFSPEGLIMDVRIEQKVFHRKADAIDSDVVTPI